MVSRCWTIEFVEGEVGSAPSGGERWAIEGSGVLKRVGCAGWVARGRRVRWLRAAGADSACATEATNAQQKERKSQRFRAPGRPARTADCRCTSPPRRRRCLRERAEEGACACVRGISVSATSVADLLRKIKSTRTLPVHRDLVAAALRDVLVEAVVGDVRLAALRGRRALQW